MTSSFLLVVLENNRSSKKLSVTNGEQAEADGTLKLTEINFRLETDNLQSLMDKVGYTGLLVELRGFCQGN